VSVNWLPLFSLSLHLQAHMPLMLFDLSLGFHFQLNWWMVILPSCVPLSTLRWTSFAHFHDENIASACWCDTFSPCLQGWFQSYNQLLRQFPQHFWVIWRSKYRDLEILVRGHWCSLEIAQFDKSYSFSIVTMAVSCTVLEIKRDNGRKMPIFHTPLYLTCTVP